MGNEDPVELCCSLVLYYDLECRAEVGVANATFPDVVKTILEHYPFQLVVLTVTTGHFQMDSSAGAVLSRKEIERAQSSAHPGQKSGIECKRKS